MAIVFEHDFEDNSLATYDANEGGGTTTIQTGTVYEGARALQCTLSSNQARLRKNFTSTQTCAMRGFVRRSTSLGETLYVLALASGDDSNSIGIRWSATGGLELMQVVGGSESSRDSIAASQDTWYRIDVKIDASANPWTVDWAVDNADQGSFGVTAAALSFDHFYQGAWVYSPTSWEVFIDDVAVGDTFAYLTDPPPSQPLRTVRAPYVWR